MKKIVQILILIATTDMCLDARLYFLHVPKTGGVTMRLLLEQQLSTKEIYPFRNQKAASRGVRDELLVSGHFSYSFCRTIDNGFDDAFKVTILRNPVERYLSYLRLKKKGDTKLKSLEAVFKQRNNPNSYYREQLIDNAMCRYLATDPQLQGDALLESAKANLDTFDCVIIFDTFADDVIALFRRLGIDLEHKDIPKINTTVKEPVSERLLQEVASLNELDMKLYNYAKEHYKQKATSYPLRTATYDDVVQRSAHIDYTFDMPLRGRNWTYRDEEPRHMFTCDRPLPTEREGRDVSPIGENNSTRPLAEPIGETDCHSQPVGSERARVNMCQKSPNPIYRWVMDTPAEIAFSLEEGLDYQFSFNAQCLTDEVEPKVLVNGKTHALERVTHALFSRYEGTIAKELLTQDPSLLTFYSDKAFNYWDIHPKAFNRNHPPLSFAVNGISIHALQRDP